MGDRIQRHKRGDKDVRQGQEKGTEEWVTGEREMKNSENARGAPK
jgi:hypothetical protein